MLRKITNCVNLNFLVERYNETVDPRVHFSECKLSNGETILVHKTQFNFETFFMQKTPRLPTIITSTQLSVNTFFMFVTNRSLKQHNLSLIYSLEHLKYSLVELYANNLNKNYNLNYNWLSLVKDFRVNVLVSLPKDNVWVTTTGIKSANWLEREVLEFYNINFLNSTDTRRLLTDYTLQKGLKNFLNIKYNNFNNEYYELFN